MGGKPSENAPQEIGPAQLLQLGKRQTNTVLNLQKELLDAYDAALASGRALPVTLADARRSVELATALYYSAATGTLVPMPIGADQPYYRGWHLRA